MRRHFTNTTEGEAGFRWRSPDVSRIENLSDIVFALALALIATSEIPQSFAALTEIWRDILATGLCFAIILIIWNAHYVFFRRYDLMDARTTFLNSALLFLVFSFAYPLKFVMGFVVDLFTLKFTTGAEINAVMSIAEGRWALILYSAGYASLFLIFTLMYAHALSDAERMALTPRERIMTQAAAERSFVHVVASAIVVAAALAAPPRIAPYMGGLYFLISVGMIIVRRREKGRLAGAASAKAAEA